MLSHTANAYTWLKLYNLSTNHITLTRFTQKSKYLTPLTFRALLTFFFPLLFA